METWDEIIAAATKAGFLTFHADGVAVLQRAKDADPAESEPPPPSAKAEQLALES